MIKGEEIYDLIAKRQKDDFKKEIKKVEVFSTLTKIFEIVNSVWVFNGKPFHNVKKNECYAALEKIQRLLGVCENKTIILYCEIDKEKEI